MPAFLYNLKIYYFYVHCEVYGLLGIWLLPLGPCLPKWKQYRSIRKGEMSNIYFPEFQTHLIPQKYQVNIKQNTLHKTRRGKIWDVLKILLEGPKEIVSCLKAKILTILGLSKSQDES